MQPAFENVNTSAVQEHGLITPNPLATDGRCNGNSMHRFERDTSRIRPHGGVEIPASHAFDGSGEKRQAMPYGAGIDGIGFCLAAGEDTPG